MSAKSGAINTLLHCQHVTASAIARLAGSGNNKRGGRASTDLSPVTTSTRPTHPPRECSHVSQMCVGETSCAYQVSEANLGDVCPGRWKWLEITYTCTRDDWAPPPPR